MTLERLIERAMIRDTSINGETAATHMLSPMPLAISLTATR